MTDSTTTVASTQSDERGNLLRKAYTTATTRLREQYRDDFDSLYSQAAEELGVTYTPKPKPEQRAEEQIAALLAEFPHLREKVVGESA